MVAFSEQGERPLSAARRDYSDCAQRYLQGELSKEIKSYSGMWNAV